MEEDNKSDNAFEPGAATFGNFINYYTFNPPEQRISLFQKDFCDFLLKNRSSSATPTVLTDTPILCSLDIGCNSGELSRGLWEMMSSQNSQQSSVHMLGVDLDCQLVERAKEMAANLFMSSGMMAKDSLQFETLNVVTEAEKRDQMWRSYLNARNRSRFDVVFCFSTTMWVHLNHGDAGLEDLLTCLASWADNVIVEPQPWKCYRNACRRLRRAQRQDAFPLFDSLIHRSDILDHIQSVLTTKLGMHLHTHLGNSEWNRPVWWFRHPIQTSSS